MGRYKGKIILINGSVMPDETLEIVIEDEKRDYYTAHVKEIKKRSQQRIQPECEYFDLCGGCSYQHIPYEMQVSMKEEMLRDCLRRVAKTEQGLEESVCSEYPWEYRVRAQFKVSPDGIGFHKKGARSVVPVGKCLLMNKQINECISRLGFLAKYRIRELHITGDDDLIAQVITRKHDLSKSRTEELASQFMDSGFCGVTFLVGGLQPIHFGKREINLDLLGLKYSVSASTFIQSNWRLNQKAIKTMKSALEPLKNARILDLYAGAGNFSLLLADKAEVTAVEGSRSAVADGKRNIEVNRIYNYRFICESAENFQSTCYYNVIILDPPRPGVSKKVMESVLDMRPEKIVYISCNPATLARDLRALFPIYAIEAVSMIDFFPQTLHIESLVFLGIR